MNLNSIIIQCITVAWAHHGSIVLALLESQDAIAKGSKCLWLNLGFNSLKIGRETEAQQGSYQLIEMLPVLIIYLKLWPYLCSIYRHTQTYTILHKMYIIYNVFEISSIIYLKSYIWNKLTYIWNKTHLWTDCICQDLIAPCYFSFSLRINVLHTIIKQVIHSSHLEYC